ncbi:MAG: ACT domain-containing protein, partial [Bryobacteraceae bacterium]
NKIKHLINATERVKAIEIGQKYLEREARRLGVPTAQIAKAQLESVAAEYGYSKIEDLHAALGYGRFSARQILQKLAPGRMPTEPPPEQVPLPAARPPAAVPGAPGKDLVIKVKGIDDLLVYRAKCCNPIRGEAIVGYVTRGKGVAVHSLHCANVQNLMYEVERKIDVEWARTESQSFPVKMIVHTEDRPGILNQLTTALVNEQTDIRSLEARGGEASEGAVIDMTVEVRDKKQLERVVSAIRRISGVRDIERINGTGRGPQDF